MADDVTHTSTSPAGPPDGTKQVTDEHATRGHMPVVKLAYSADGNATHVTADADGLLVNLGTNNDVTVTGNVAVTNAGLTALNGAISGTEVQVDVLTMPSTAVTNAGTFAVQVDGSALTALQLIDDPVATLGTTTYTETTSKGMIIGAVRRDADTTLVDTTNEISPLQVDAAGRLKVEIFDGGDSHTVDGTVTANQGGTWNIGTVTTVTGVTTVTTVTTCSTLTGSGVAHGGADSGNPHKIGAKAKASTEGVTLVSADQRTDLYADVDGVLVVKQSCTNDDVVSERVSNTDGASTAFSNFAAVASTHNCVSAISIFNSSASAVFIDFRDGTAGSVLFTMGAPAGGGSVISCGNQPYLFRTSQNTALAFDGSAAASTVYISVSGYQSKA